jgi:hypothetical protein
MAFQSDPKRIMASFLHRVSISVSGSMQHRKDMDPGTGDAAQLNSVTQSEPRQRTHLTKRCYNIYRCVDLIVLRTGGIFAVGRCIPWTIICLGAFCLGIGIGGVMHIQVFDPDPAVARSFFVDVLRLVNGPTAQGHTQRPPMSSIALPDLWAAATSQRTCPSRSLNPVRRP